MDYSLNSLICCIPVRNLILKLVFFYQLCLTIYQKRNIIVKEREEERKTSICLKLYFISALTDLHR